MSKPMMDLLTAIKTLDIAMPAMATLSFTLPPKAHLSIDGLWIKNREVTIALPYPATFESSLLYAVSALGKFSAVPYANMADNQETANVVTESLNRWVTTAAELVTAHIEKENPELDVMSIEDGTGFRVDISLSFEAYDTLVFCNNNN